ncbi:MAG TPA: membrane protein insertion efficiency factor YidD [Patescibacteria group bacterium]|nr:membrane protein insertion efficiency factor YidD [Patescibacteria group bacterium]
MKSLVTKFLKGYKKTLSPISETFFGKACRFTPTCSEYTTEAVEKFGPVKGIGMGIKRVARCHPWGDFGYDPVPGQ